MTSSNDAEPRRLAVQQLRPGGWTRLGGPGVLDDLVTEDLLGGLADRAQTAARAQGYAHGWAAGRREALTQERDAAEQRALLVQQEWDERDRQRSLEHTAAITALADTLADVEDRASRLCERIEGQAVELAYALVEHLLGRELAVAPDEDAARRALSLLPPEGVAAVRLHPGTDASALHERGIQVREDPALAEHDVVVELADGAVVDGRMAAALRRLREVWKL